MTVCERHLEEPPTVHAPLHGMGAGIPFIEIADQIYGFRSRCSTVEIDRFDHIPGRIEGAAGILMQDIHRQVLASLLVVGSIFIRSFRRKISRFPGTGGILLPSHGAARGRLVVPPSAAHTRSSPVSIPGGWEADA